MSDTSHDARVNKVKAMLWDVGNKLTEAEERVAFLKQCKGALLSDLGRVEQRASEQAAESGQLEREFIARCERAGVRPLSPEGTLIKENVLREAKVRKENALAEKYERELQERQGQ